MQVESNTKIAADIVLRELEAETDIPTGWGLVAETDLEAKIDRKLEVDLVVETDAETKIEVKVETELAVEVEVGTNPAVEKEWTKNTSRNWYFQVIRAGV